MITIKHSNAETIGPYKIFYTGDVDIIITGKVNNTSMNYELYAHISLLYELLKLLQHCNCYCYYECNLYKWQKESCQCLLKASVNHCKAGV